MRQLRLLPLLALALVALLLAIGYSSVSKAQSARPRVVASFSINGDFVQNLAGGAVDLQTLVGPDADTHTFEPSPADAAALFNADLIVEHGLGFETWLDDLYQSSRSQASRVALTEGLTGLLTSEHEEEPAAGEAHGHGELDPHVWHDVSLAIQMVQNTRDALALADPANAALYEANAGRYVAELQALDGWVFQEVSRLPESRRKLVTSHDTFEYFARRYGFEIVGTVLPVSSEAADPSAGEIAALVEQIRAAGVPVIFVENIINPALTEQIAAAAGVRVGPPLYTDALGRPGSDGDSYVKMVRYNVSTIVSSLAQ